jgi:adenylyl- and sulfurtransferase ThiI
VSKQPAIEIRLTNLEQRVASLEGGRPGRKGLPILVSEEGICGVDPGIDSASCSHASIYRHQKGCRGEACVQKSSEYYKNYREGKSAKDRKKVRRRNGQ